MPRYEHFAYEGYKFVFKYDEDIPNLLHIWVRHLKTVEDAVEIWFEGTEEIWNRRAQSDLKHIQPSRASTGLG